MYNYEEGFNDSAAMGAATQPSMPVPMPRNGQFVPNVMMDMQNEQMQQMQHQHQQQQQPNAPIDLMYTNQTEYPPEYDGVQPQAATYDLNLPPFEIEDPMMRRQFFRKVFLILLLQNIMALPVIEIFLLSSNGPLPLGVYYSLWMVGILMFILMYIFSDYRRYMPVNMLALFISTLLIVLQEGVYATFVGTSIAFTSQLVVIFQFLAMLAYSKQTRFRFTNVNAILVAIFIYFLAFGIVGLIAPRFLYGVKVWSAFNVIYCVYDMQLMLSGHHGYNLKAEEHIFGATNIYADMPNLLWRFFRYIFLDHFVRMYQFFVKCCFAEVC